MSLKQVDPETFYINPTPHVPNSRLPIIVYRNVLQDTSPENILSTIEPNDWLIGGQWKTYKTPHFHAMAHECYAIIRGSSTYLLGKSESDNETDENGKPTGVQLHVQVGDVFVLPVGAGTILLQPNLTIDRPEWATVLWTQQGTMSLLVCIRK